MLTKEKKKNTSSNINININLKLQAKHQKHTVNGMVGKKILRDKQVKKGMETLRPTTQHYSRKKTSCHQTNPSKQSVQEFVEEKTVSYERQEENNNAFANMDRRQVSRKGVNITKKRLKSKSLQNLKVRYYARTPELVSRSNSKLTSKSKSKGFSRSQSNGNSKSKSKSRSKKIGDLEIKSSPRSFLHSDKKKYKERRSKSKSPILPRKKSLQGFKIRGQISSREFHKEKSKEKKWDKNITTVKKTQNSQPSFDKGSKTLQNLKRPMENNVKPKLRKSKETFKQSSPVRKRKPSKKSQQVAPNRTSSKGMYPVPMKVSYLSKVDKMALRIQSLWRGYRVRKLFRNELYEISEKIQHKKETIYRPMELWSSSSNHSIIPIQNEVNQTDKPSKNVSERGSQSSINPHIMIEFQKLRKKMEEQEDRFKKMAQQNEELRQNLSKMGKEKEKQKSRQSKQLILNHNVISMRIESQQSQGEESLERRSQKMKRKKQKMESLQCAIKTQESRQDLDLNELKKKVENYECSPKNQPFNIKFDRTLIQKILSQQQEKMNLKYFRKNNEFKNMLQSELVSPKTYNQKCSELQFRLRREKEETLGKYKQAEKALLLIAELSQQKDESVVEQENDNNINRKISFEHSVSSPRPNSLNTTNVFASPQNKGHLVINVDEIESNHQQYYPMVSNINNSRRQPDPQCQGQDLSELYQRAMNDKVDSKKNAYLSSENDSPNQQFRDDSIETMNKTEIAQYPEFQLEKAASLNEVKGFKTDLKYIRLFYIKFCQYFRQVPAFRQQILTNTTSPVTFDNQLYLRSFRIMSEQVQSNSFQLVFPYFKYLATYNTAIPVHILNAYYSELTNEESSLYDQETLGLKAVSKQEYTQVGYSGYELKQYYDLALIDAFNEAINYQRPGGVEASNLDDLTQQYRSICKDRLGKRLSESIPELQREQNLNILLGNTIGRIVNVWACSLCGFINDCTEEDEQKIDESKLQQIRTHRLSLLLEKSLLQEEQSIVNMHPFMLYIRLELANAISNHLINEASSDCLEIMEDS